MKDDLHQGSVLSPLFKVDQTHNPLMIHSTIKDFQHVNFFNPQTSELYNIRFKKFSLDIDWKSRFIALINIEN